MLSFSYKNLILNGYNLSLCFCLILQPVLALNNLRHSLLLLSLFILTYSSHSDVYSTFLTLGSLLSLEVTLTFPERILDTGRLTAWSSNMKSQVWKVRKLTLKSSFCHLLDSEQSKSFWLKGKLGYLLSAFYYTFFVADQTFIRRLLKIP